MLSKSFVLANKLTHTLPSLHYGSTARSFSQSRSDGGNANKGFASMTHEKVQEVGSMGNKSRIHQDRIGEAPVSRENAAKSHNQQSDHSVGDRSVEQGEAFLNKNLNNVVGGYKATLNNPRVGEHAKARAEHLLNDMENSHPGITEDSITTQYKKDPNHSSNTGAQGYGSMPRGQAQDIPSASQGGRSYGNSSQSSSNNSNLRSDHGREATGTHSVNPNNVMGGYKATISNPNVSDAAKAHAEQVLNNGAQNLQASRTTSRTSDTIRTDHGREATGTHSVNQNNVMGGYKATISNPNVSDQAKAHAEQVLNNNGAQNMQNSRTTHQSSQSSRMDHGREATGTHSVNQNNVMGGYKATISNPNVSDQAKAHAEQVLNNNGAQNMQNSRTIRHPSDATRMDHTSTTRQHSNSTTHASSSMNAENLNPVHEVSDASNPTPLEHKSDPMMTTTEERNAGIRNDPKPIPNTHSNNVMGNANGIPTPSAPGNANPNNVMGGYKATISNPNISDGAKAHAEEVLANNGKSTQRN